MRSKRIEEIRQYLYLHKTVTLDQLCEEFGVSKNTIRRDIEELLADRNIRKIYGGVTVEMKKDLVSFSERNITNLLAKQRIAAKASELVEDGDIIFLDSGTTTFHMIDHLKERQNLTILTNNLEVIMRAIPYDNIRVVSLSGVLNRQTLSFTGYSAAQVLQNYNISKAFMGTTGISVKNGLTNSSPMEFDIKNTAVKRSRQVFLLADFHKFDMVSLMTYCKIEDLDALITDEMPLSPMREYFEEHDIGILLAGKA